MNTIIIAISDQFSKAVHECKALLKKGDNVVLESDSGKHYSFYVKERLYDPIKNQWTFLTTNNSGIDVENMLNKYKKAI